MSVSPTPVTHVAPRTACSVLMTSTANAGLATLVCARGRGVGWADGQGQQGWLLTVSPTGRRCESVINGCRGKPCKNGGVCAVASNTARGFICRCPAVRVPGSVPLQGRQV